VSTLRVGGAELAGVGRAPVSFWIAAKIGMKTSVS
jgi:hypothetical protein